MCLSIENKCTSYHRTHHLSLITMDLGFSLACISVDICFFIFFYFFHFFLQISLILSCTDYLLVNFLHAQVFLTVSLNEIPFRKESLLLVWCVFYEIFLISILFLFSSFFFPGIYTLFLNDSCSLQCFLVFNPFSFTLLS